ncbi:MAG: heavy metal-associated domain-containing protein [Solitalea sp.]
MKKKYAITGMTCSGCAGVVRNVLSGVAGVKHVEVSLEQHEALVEADESVTTEALAEALEKTPYRLSETAAQ